MVHIRPYLLLLCAALRRGALIFYCHDIKSTNYVKGISFFHTMCRFKWSALSELIDSIYFEFHSYRLNKACVF